MSMGGEATLPPSWVARSRAAWRVRHIDVEGGAQAAARALAADATAQAGGGAINHGVVAELGGRSAEIPAEHFGVELLRLCRIGAHDLEVNDLLAHATVPFV